MAKLFNVCIIDPDKIIYEARVMSLIVPAAYGYLGILADHAPLVANLVKGKIIVKETADKMITYGSKAKGFLEVLKNRVNVILTEPSSVEVQNA